MPVLLTLSILTFVALLWATISIAGRVRRSRRRRRRRAAEAAGVDGQGIATSPAKPSALLYTEPDAVPRPGVVREISPPDITDITDNSAVPEPPLVDVPNGTAIPHVFASDAQTAAPELLNPPPPRLRTFPTRLGKHPVLDANSGVPPKWNPFGTEFGDLTDPSPSRRGTQARPRNRDRDR